MAHLHPQEIFLLERFSSLDYLKQLRDAWKAFVEHNERCLEEFMYHLPPDLRSRHLSQQPDIVWGNTVLPNFRVALDRIEEACIQRASGDPKGYEIGGGIRSCNKGESDYWKGWMTQEDEKNYYNLLSAAGLLDGNIERTMSGMWQESYLTKNFDSEYFGLLDLPARIPRYCVDETVQIFSGDVIDITGVYLPEQTNACAQFLYALPGKKRSLFSPFTTPTESRVAGEVRVGLQKNKYGEWIDDEWQPTRWTLVRRAEGEFIDVPPEGFFPENSLVTGCCEANHRCPGSGYWWTPAKENSRRQFNEGELMPDYPDSQYGETIWYWDQQQG
ncbi:MAG: hypothetical protein H6R07_3411 [Proteobacteria bacterium]|nr:hypothetical protein [Pseudomonadota bacterium]